MYKYFIINCLYIILFTIFTSCNTQEEFDTQLVNKHENAELSHESFQRSLDFTSAWLQKTDPETGLIPSNLGDKVDLWDPANGPIIILYGAYCLYIRF